jgi:hypothetical protein
MTGAEARPMKARTNAGLIGRAVDFGGDVYETAAGRLVTIGKTYVEGSAAALEELADAAEELADENLGVEASFADDAGTTFAELRLTRSLEALGRAVAKIRSAVE